MLKKIDENKVNVGGVLLFNLNDNKNNEIKHMYIVDWKYAGLIAASEIIPYSQLKDFPMFLNFKISKRNWSFLDKENALNLSPCILFWDFNGLEKYKLKKGNNFVRHKNVMSDEIIRWKNRRIYSALFNLILENKLNFEQHKISSFKAMVFKNDKFIKKYCNLILKYNEEEYNALPWYISRKIRVKVIEKIEDLF